MSRALQIVAFVQAGYFLVTGIWPLISIRTFMGVTGPKTDVWLVKTVGLLVGVVGAVIGLAAWRGRMTTEIILLAIACAAALTAIDVVYVAKRVIARIYLADVVAEVILIAAWIWAWGVRG
jgi:hypothetical protein